MLILHTHIDRTGYGAHGDYLFGWKDDALQRAMDSLGTACASEDCTQILKIQDGKDAIGCTKAQQAKEDVGTSTCKRAPTTPKLDRLTCFIGLNALPGGMPVM